MAAFGLVGALASLGDPERHRASRRCRAWPPPSPGRWRCGCWSPRRGARRSTAPVTAPARRAPLTRGGVGSRRAFLGLTAAVAASAAVAAAGGRALRSRFSAAESRAGVTLPRAGRAAAPDPGDGRGRRRRHRPVRHPEPRLLPRRHGADRPAGAGRGLDPVGHRHGRRAVRAHLRRAGRPRHRRGRHHDDVRLEPGRRRPRRQRPLARRAHPRPARPRPAAAAGRPARRPVDRRLHVRVPHRGRLRPPVPRGHRA